ncbi:MAG TPA: hypothetical protein VKA21_14910 [Candidatus Binatia bacterium]|nr:hypothetical protein [Candidatus Binatia bacterium]
MPLSRAVALLLLVLVAPAHGAPRTLKLRFPRVTVPAGGNLEACYFIRRPATARFDLGRYTIHHRGVGGSFGVRHFLVYLYGGEQLAAFAQDAGRVVASRGCQDLGPADRDRRQLITLGRPLPPGVALPLDPVPDTPGGPPAGIGILLDGEWVNGDTQPRRARTVVTLHRAPRRSIRRRLAPILARTAERGLAVAPGAIGSTETSTAALGLPPDAWGAGLATDGVPPPAGRACVVAVTSHLRKRGVLLAVDRQRAGGAIDNPPDGPRNPFDGRIHLFATRDFTDPGAFVPSPPLALDAGEALRYACWHDNGATNVARQGCEEVAGEPPGRPAAVAGGGPAKPCLVAGPASPDCPASDSAYPGRSFTGACVEANLVAGPTPDDEVCALAGFYYDAAPDGGCDVSGLPPLE